MSDIYHQKYPARYYLYYYVRKNNSRTTPGGSAGTPYYVGIGQTNRAWVWHGKHITVPKNKDQIIIVAEDLEEFSAKKMEIMHIKLWGRKDINTGILHNRTNGGEGSSGRIVSTETRNKLSERNRRYKPSDATRLKISQANKGRVTSEVTKAKISQAARSRKHTDETKQKLRALKLGSKTKPHTAETKKKIGDSHRGKIISEESRQKLSKSMRQSHQTPEFREKMSKIKSVISDETRRKMSLAAQNRAAKNKLKSTS